MAFTTAKMGLRVWNLLTDLYDHAQLADNWAKVDYHDHSPGKGVQIPTDGLADGAVTSAKIATALDPSGAFTVFRNIYADTGKFVSSTAAGTYLFDPSSGSGFTISTGGSGESIFYFEPADYAVAGRTPMLRLKTNLQTNAVASTSNFTFGLYPVTAVAGGSGTLVATLGTVIAGSTVLYTAPAASSMFHGETAEFALPAAGYYALGVVSSATIATNAHVAMQVFLQVRWP